MKCAPIYFFIAVSFIVLAVSCNTQSNKNDPETATDTLVNTGGQNAESAYSHGARLVAANDCLTCHKIDSQSIGPSYDQISQKYPFDTGVVENLAHSIIHGSKGLYGDKAMTPHPNVTFRDAKEMAAYIMSLKHQPNAETTSK
jgi:cytochrome c